MKVVFFGTPQFAVPTLKKLISEKFEVVAVVTMPDRPAHRGQKDQPSPVKVVAEQNKIPVYYEIPSVDQLKKWGTEKIVVIAYGKMIPEVIYKNWHSLNVHPSKLPQYRGPSPLQSALLNGDAQNLDPKQDFELMRDFFIRAHQQGIKKNSPDFINSMLSDPYLNALRVKYGYAITCHKAQGGEWQHVFVALEPVLFVQDKQFTYRWVYTAISRAINEVFFLQNRCLY